MATKTIKLKAFDFAQNEAIVQVDGNKVSTSVDAAKNVIIAPGYGSFEYATDGNVTFVADSALAGDVSLALETGVSVDADSAATITAADFRKTTAGIKYVGEADVVSIFGGKGNDTLTTGEDTTSIDAGAGDDYVKVSVAGSDVTLGAGADTLEQSGAVAIGVKDYSYADGDLISVTGGTVAIDATNGDFAVNTNVTGTLTAKDNWFELKANNGTLIDYHTAVDGGYAPVDVKLDLSKSRVQNEVDASAAKTANIVLGYGADSVTLGAGNGADTITVSKIGGTDVITGWDKASDVLVINGGKINKDVKISADNTNDVVVDYANTKVSLVGAAASSVGALNFNDGTSTQKVVFDLAAGGSAALDGSADLVIGGALTTVTASEDTHLHEDKFVGGISKITVAGGLDKTINLTGNDKLANEIDATGATVGVQIWGYSDKKDSITLGSGVDTLWFGANDGTDTVSSFTYGTASDSDVLYLIGAESVKDIKAGFVGADANFSVGSAVAKINANTTANDIINVKIGENVYKVAGSYTTANNVKINTDTAGAFDYYAFEANANNKIVVTGGKDFVVNTTYTDAYTTGAILDSVDASAVTGGNITIAGVASVSTGAGTNNVWNYGVANATKVDLAAAPGTGTDTVWFADGIDTSVTVNNFGTEDTLYFVTSSNLRDIVSAYDFSENAGDAVISGETSQITLKAAGTKVINLKAGDNTYKAACVAAGTALDFASDVNVYFGGNKITVGSSVTEGSYTVRVGENSRGVDTADSVYISDSIVEFDASKSTAEFIIAGNSQADTTIKGGLTKNDLYGGGASSDELHGNVSAIDTFWFGTGDGNDAIFAVNDDDTVNLWNVDDADIQNITIEVDPSGTEKVILSDSSALTINDTGNAALTGGLTFTSAQGTAYTYDSESKKLVEKKA